MDDIYYEQLLYRILQGRLRVKLGDLVLFIHEPNRDDIEESFEVYEDAYKKAYFEGVFIKQEILEILLKNGMWSPHDDEEAKKIEKQIEDMKVEAFRSFHNPNKLGAIKRHMRHMENVMIEFKTKKVALDHTTCEGNAKFAQSVWLISNNTKYRDGSSYTWGECSISSLMDIYTREGISTADFRKIARSDPWRAMWNIGKKQGNIFDKPTCELTKDQANLCSYSTMYDNVYESAESPKEKVINDDDCLDGWFIVQRRDMEKRKKQIEVDNLTKNPKIKNAQEVFLMADSQEGVKEILDLNHPHSRGIINQRNAQIDQDGSIKHTHLPDVKQDISMQRHKQFADKARGGG